MRSSRIAIAAAIALVFFAPQAIAEEVEETSTELVEEAGALAASEAAAAVPGEEVAEAPEASREPTPTRSNSDRWASTRRAARVASTSSCLETPSGTFPTPTSARPGCGRRSGGITRESRIPT
jgi:hypothetical protein